MARIQFNIIHPSRVHKTLRFDPVGSESVNVSEEVANLRSLSDQPCVWNCMLLTENLSLIRDALKIALLSSTHRDERKNELLQTKVFSLVMSDTFFKTILIC